MQAVQKVYFVVDDEMGVVTPLSIFLQRLDPAGIVKTFTNPVEALAQARLTPPDLIISDQRMPQMRGSQLLAEVQKVAPKAIRVIMSGFIGTSDLAKISAAHHYISKPWDFKKLRDFITRAFAARDLLPDEEMRKTIVSLGSVPSIPPIFHELMEELNKDDSSSEMIAQIIAKDMGITTKLIHLANSPMFGSNMPVNHPMDAVNILGTDVTKAVVLAQRLTENYARLHHSDIDISKLWQHCWDTANLARQIAIERKLGALAGQNCFLAGLLHELGTFILLDNYPSIVRSALAEAQAHHTTLNEQLLVKLKVTPPLITAYLLQLWGLPAPVVEMVKEICNAPALVSSKWTALDALYIANGISTRRIHPTPLVEGEWNEIYLSSLDCKHCLEAWQSLPIH